MAKKKVAAKKVTKEVVEAKKTSFEKTPHPLANGTAVVEAFEQAYAFMTGPVGKYLPTVRGMMANFKNYRIQLREELARAVARGNLR